MLRRRRKRKPRKTFSGESSMAKSSTAKTQEAKAGNFLVATDSRLLEVKAFPAIKVTAVPVREIHGIELRRSLMGRLLGYGTFVIRTSGADKKIRFLPFPEQRYLEVWGTLTPARDEEQ